MDKTKELDHAGTLELEHVLGLTVFSNSALTSDPLSGLVAYPAGCVLVLLDCVKYKYVMDFGFNNFHCSVSFYTCISCLCASPPVKDILYHR